MKQPEHLLGALDQRVTQLQDRPALWTRGRRHFVPVSWRQFGQRVRCQAVGLMAAGIKPGDAVGVPELPGMEAWISRLAVLATGAAYVSLPAGQSEEAGRELARRLEVSRAKAFYGLGATPAPSLLPKPPRKGAKRTAFFSLDASDAQPDSYAALMASGSGAGDADYWWATRRIGAGEAAAWLFDGEGPLQLSHANVVWTAWKRSHALHLEEEVTFLSDWRDGEGDSFHWFWTCLSGSELAFAPQPLNVHEMLVELRPTVAQLPASAWTELGEKARVFAAPVTGPLGWPLAHARRMAVEHQRRVEVKERVPLSLQAQLEAARVFLLPVQRQLGLDRIKAAVVSGGGVRPETLELFASLGVVLCESHGVAATSGLATLNVPNQTKLGSSGRPLLGSEVRVDGGGQVWIRGQNVSRTRIKGKGSSWLHLGSGRMDDDGFVWMAK